MTRKYDKILLLIVVIIAIAVGSQILKTPPLTEDETYPYPSFHVELERQFFQEKFIQNGLQESKITLNGRLHLPKNTTTPLPAIIFQHGSGGNNLLQSWYKEITAALNAKGIAVLIADSHTQRNLTSTADDQTALSSANRLLDAVQALKTLAKDPRIDSSRIAIAGDSYGAFVTMRLAEDTIMQVLAPNGERFAAHAMLYPACNATPRNVALTGAPLLMLVGGKDDYTIAEDCLHYSKRIKQRYYDIETHIFQNAYHGWLYNIPPVKFGKAQTFNNCQIVFFDNGDMLLPEYNISTENYSLEEFYDAIFASGCVGLGAHVGGDKVARAGSKKLLVEFFTKHLINE